MARRIFPGLKCGRATGAIPAAAGAQFVTALTPEHTEFFERKVRPVLVEHCYECHSAGAKKIKGGLVLDSRAGVHQGRRHRRRHHARRSRSQPADSSGSPHRSGSRDAAEEETSAASSSPISKHGCAWVRLIRARKTPSRPRRRSPPSTGTRRANGGRSVR